MTNQPKINRTEQLEKERIELISAISNLESTNFNKLDTIEAELKGRKEATEEIMKILQKTKKIDCFLFVEIKKIGGLK